MLMLPVCFWRRAVVICSHQRAAVFFFFFNDTATTEIYTLSLHDALPICMPPPPPAAEKAKPHHHHKKHAEPKGQRSEEHTSELQSHLNLVCRLLLEKKKNGDTRQICRALAFSAVRWRYDPSSDREAAARC